MKTISLTQDKYAIVDDEDFERLNQWKWRCQKYHSGFRAVRTSSLLETPKKRIAILMHRLIMSARRGKHGTSSVTSMICG